MKGRLAASHKQIALARKRALAAQESAKRAVEAKKRELDEMVRAMNAQLAPLQKQMERLQDGIFAFNLYLGRDEEVIPVLDGERAPAGTVVTLRQMTLNMDEESALNADTDGIDFRDVNLFADWLRADQTHVDQLIPETKAVVALRPRRDAAKKHSNYGYERAEENWDTFWLIRNGACLWLTTTPFQVGARMIPTANEFTRMFVTTDREGRTVSLVPGSPAWLRAEEAADKTTRHYMKVALILQGLVDRTKVFHPLPAGGLSFIEQRFYDDGTVQVISDAELALTSGRPPFHDWLKERQKALRAGMRVVGAFSGYGRGFSARSNREDGSRANVTPEGHRPADGVYSVKLVNDRDFDFSFTFERADTVWDEQTWSYRTPKTKATCKFRVGDKFIVPVDTITVEDIEYYLGARSERHAYADMFPLLKAALTFKQEEAGQEAPFRDALVAKLAADYGDDLAQAASDADELIAWFKLGNKWHRPLLPEDAKASKLIFAEARRRHSGADRDEEVTATLHARFPDAMVIARRTSDYVVAVPEARQYPVPAVADNVFVNLTVVNAAGAVKDSRPWAVLSKTQVAKWTILFSDNRWAGWDVGASAKTHLTDQEVTALIDTVRADADSTPFLIRISEGGVDDDRDQLVASFDTAENGRHHHGSVVITKNSTGTTFTVRDTREDHMTASRNEPSWQQRIWGRIRPDHVVWNDEEAEGQLLEAVAARAVDDAADRARSGEAWTLTRSVQDAWMSREWAKLRTRYVEDFGDDDLWEEHQKTVKAPRYPYDDSPNNWSQTKTSLHATVRALVEAGHPPYGLTVREAVARHTELALPAPATRWGKEPLPVPDELLDLRFRDASV